MKARILLLLILAGIFFSCSDTENPLDGSDRLMPLALTIDLNDDGLDDVKIEYNVTITNGEPEEYFGYLFPLNGAEFLTNTAISQAMFLMPGDEITREVATPLTYSSSIMPVISRRAEETTWTVNSVPLMSIPLDSLPPTVLERHMNPAYIGVKIVSNETIYVGWIKINFNTSDGEPTLTTKSSATNNCLIDQ